MNIQAPNVGFFQMKPQILGLNFSKHFLEVKPQWRNGLIICDFEWEPLCIMSVLHPVLKSFNILKQQSQKLCDSIYKRTKKKSRKLLWESEKYKERKQRNKIERDEKARVFSERGKRQREGGKEKHPSPFLGPLQEGMAPICPTLTFERILDYTGEEGRQRWEKRDSSTGVCGAAQMMLRRHNNKKSRVKITGHWEKGDNVVYRAWYRLLKNLSPPRSRHLLPLSGSYGTQLRGYMWARRRGSTRQPLPDWLDNEDSKHP